MFTHFAAKTYDLEAGLDRGGTGEMCGEEGSGEGERESECRRLINK